MRILQLTDTHLFGGPRARHYDRIDTAAALREVLARVRGMEGVDAVVHTGDASDDGTPASYRLLHEILDPFVAELGAPLVVTMGNHDTPAAYTEVAGPGDHGGPWQDRVHDLPGGGRVIVLDSSVPGAGFGHLDPEQLAWLREVLAARVDGGAGDGGANGPTVLAIHHPPLVGATPLLRGLDLDDLDALAEVLEGSDVRAILSGHYHHPMTGSIAGIPVLVGPGITNIVDPLAPGGIERAGARSGAQIVEIDVPGAPGVRATSAEWPSGGDTQDAPDRPVYEFGPDVVAQILACAGR